MIGIVILVFVTSVLPELINEAVRNELAPMRFWPNIFRVELENREERRIKGLFEAVSAALRTLVFPFSRVLRGPVLRP